MLTADSQIIVYLDLFPHSIEMEARVRATAYMVSAYMDTPGNTITVETHFIDSLYSQEVSNLIIDGTGMKYCIVR